MNMTLWKFKLTVKDREKAIREDGLLTRDGAPITFLGVAVAANNMAKGFQQELVAQFPGKDVAVRAAVSERVGPYLQAHLGRLAASAQDWKMLARHLAFRMAQNQAQKELQLNPNIGAIAQKIIEIARLQI